MSHTERYCRKFLDKPGGSINKEWGEWLPAPPRRSSDPSKSKWLREEGDIDCEERVGRVNVNLKSRDDSFTIEGNQIISKNIFMQSAQQTGPLHYPKNTGVNIAEF